MNGVQITVYYSPANAKCAMPHAAFCRSQTSVPAFPRFERLRQDASIRKKPQSGIIEAGPRSQNRSEILRLVAGLGIVKIKRRALNARRPLLPVLHCRDSLFQETSGTKRWHLQVLSTTAALASSSLPSFLFRPRSTNQVDWLE